MAGLICSSPGEFSVCMPLCGLFNPEDVWAGLGLYVRRLIEMLEMTNEAGVTRLWGREE